MDVLVDDKKDRNAILKELNRLRYDERRKYAEGTPERDKLEHDIEALINKYSKVAFMVQGADGDAAISVFNAGGIKHESRVNYFKKLDIEDRNKRLQFFKDNNIETTNIDNPYIPIQEKSSINAILFGAGVTLPVGTVFLNADVRDKAQYVVRKIDDKLGIVRKDGKKIILDGLTAKNGVMVLRKAFRGRPAAPQSFYNEQYNFVSEPYKKADNVKQGKQLSIIAR